MFGLVGPVEKFFLAVHGCTAGNPAGGYAENEEFVESASVWELKPEGKSGNNAGLTNALETRRIYDLTF